MEDEGGGVIATEKYGSQEAWRYRVTDGGMQRERTGEERMSRGTSITDAFKVIYPKQSYRMLYYYQGHNSWKVQKQRQNQIRRLKSLLLSFLFFSERFPASGLPRECQ